MPRGSALSLDLRSDPALFSRKLVGCWTVLKTLRVPRPQQWCLPHSNVAVAIQGLELLRPRPYPAWAGDTCGVPGTPELGARNQATVSPESRYELALSHALPASLAGETGSGASPPRGPDRGRPGHHRTETGRRRGLPQSEGGQRNRLRPTPYSGRLSDPHARRGIPRRPVRTLSRTRARRRPEPDRGPSPESAFPRVSNCQRPCDLKAQ